MLLPWKQALTLKGAALAFLSEEMFVPSLLHYLPQLFNCHCVITKNEGKNISAVVCWWVWMSKASQPTCRQRNPVLPSCSSTHDTTRPFSWIVLRMTGEYNCSFLLLQFLSITVQNKFLICRCVQRCVIHFEKDNNRQNPFLTSVKHTQGTIMLNTVASWEKAIS